MQTYFNLSEEEFKHIPLIIQVTEPKLEDPLFCRFAYCHELQCEIVVECFYKPISKMLSYDL